MRGGRAQLGAISSRQLLQKGLPKGRACSRCAGLSGSPGRRKGHKPDPDQLRGAGPGDLSLAKMARTKAQKAAPLDHENPVLGQRPGTMLRASEEGIRGWGCLCTQAEVRKGFGAGDARAPRLRLGRDSGLGMPVYPG